MLARVSPMCCSLARILSARANEGPPMKGEGFCRERTRKNAKADGDFLSREAGQTKLTKGSFSHGGAGSPEPALPPVQGAFLRLRTRRTNAATNPQVLDQW
jgi:hypothetical protein